jgi:hypothetical protein
MREHVAALTYILFVSARKVLVFSPLLQVTPQNGFVKVFTKLLQVRKPRVVQ